jgi:hypothetical protein
MTATQSPAAVDRSALDAFERAYAPFRAELDELLPPDTPVLEAHAHLGLDEDGRSLDAATLLGFLDLIDPTARACVFPLHDPDRRPAYRVPNDRVLRWAAEAGDRLIPFCRLDPAEDPVAEAERCLGRGARGIKLHPRAQAFGFGDPAADAIFRVAHEHRVPILIHAGRGMPTMEPLARLALRHPDVTLILAHAGTADQGVFATLLGEHPAILYDTSCFAAHDIVELFARVPAERIVFASDPPYGRPVGGLYLALRAAAYAGLDGDDRRLVAGGTMGAVLEGSPLPERTPPRLPAARLVNGRLARVYGYGLMAFGGFFSGGPAGLAPAVGLARGVCRDPDPGPVGPALERIDAALAVVEELIAGPPEAATLAIGLIHASLTVAATEPCPSEL